MVEKRLCASAIVLPRLSVMARIGTAVPRGALRLCEQKNH